MDNELKRTLVLAGIPLVEMVSSVVYHFCPFKSAISILTNDELTSRGASYISTTRSLNGTFHKDNKAIGIIFKLDGGKLNANYSGGAHGTDEYMHLESGNEYVRGDYIETFEDLHDLDAEKGGHTLHNYMVKKYGADWQTDHRIVSDEDYNTLLVKVPYDLVMGGKSNGQLEDRIRTKRIRNFSKYILHAFVYIPAEYNEGDDLHGWVGSDEWGETYGDQLKYAHSAIKCIRNAGIPFSYMDSESDLIYNKNR